MFQNVLHRTCPTKHLTALCEDADLVSVEVLVALLQKPIGVDVQHFYRGSTFYLLLNDLKMENFFDVNEGQCRYSRVDVDDLQSV